jgi:hypothetical protein
MKICRQSFGGWLIAGHCRDGGHNRNRRADHDLFILWRDGKANRASERK